MEAGWPGHSWVWVAGVRGPVRIIHFRLPLPACQCRVCECSVLGQADQRGTRGRTAASEPRKHLLAERGTITAMDVAACRGVAPEACQPGYPGHPQSPCSQTRLSGRPRGNPRQGAQGTSSLKGKGREAQPGVPPSCPRPCAPPCSQRQATQGTWSERPLQD